MGYNEEKAKICYDLYKAGKPFKKVYAAVEKDGKYIVLKKFKSDGTIRLGLEKSSFIFITF